MTTISPKPVYLYNTLTRSKDLFTPLNPPRVGIYNCGPTVYRDIHIGNFRSFITTDWLRRMLEYNGYERVDTDGSRWRYPSIKMRLKISRCGNTVMRDVR